VDEKEIMQPSVENGSALPICPILVMVGILSSLFLEKKKDK